MVTLTLISYNDTSITVKVDVTSGASGACVLYYRKGTQQWTVDTGGRSIPTSTVVSFNHTTIGRHSTINGVLAGLVTQGTSYSIMAKVVRAAPHSVEFSNVIQINPVTSFQDLGIDWTPSGNDLAASLGISCLNGVTGLTSIVNRATTFALAPDIENCPNLASVSFPNLTTAGTNDFTIIACPVLATLTMPAFLPSNGQSLYFYQNALTAASVNGILARAVANAAYVSGNLILNGGTNAAPTQAGITNKAALISRGVNVQTN